MKTIALITCICFTVWQGDKPICLVWFACSVWLIWKLQKDAE